MLTNMTMIGYPVDQTYALFTSAMKTLKITRTRLHGAFLDTEKQKIFHFTLTHAASHAEELKKKEIR